RSRSPAEQPVPSGTSPKHGWPATGMDNIAGVAAEYQRGTCDIGSDFDPIVPTLRVDLYSADRFGECAIDHGRVIGIDLDANAAGNTADRDLVFVLGAEDDQHELTGVLAIAFEISDTEGRLTARLQGAP